MTRYRTLVSAAADSSKGLACPRWLPWPICIVGVYGLILAATAAVGTSSAPVPRPPIANLLDKPFNEDAFYMFSVARSLGTGQGLTYGGTRTTGVQPLA